MSGVIEEDHCTEKPGDTWFVRCQGLVPRLLAELEGAFPAASIYTPADHGARGTLDWPSMDELADAGKRVVVASAADYGEVGPAPPARQAPQRYAL